LITRSKPRGPVLGDLEAVDVVAAISRTNVVRLAYDVTDFTGSHA